MAEQGEEVMGTEPAVNTKVTEAHLCKAAEDLVHVQAEIAELNAHYTTLSTRCTIATVPDVTPIKLLET
eukprot:10682860-Ditylum_brightwellii.AAC.1